MVRGDWQWRAGAHAAVATEPIAQELCAHAVLRDAQLPGQAGRIEPLERRAVRRLPQQEQDAGERQVQQLIFAHPPLLRRQRMVQHLAQEHCVTAVRTRPAARLRDSAQPAHSKRSEHERQHVVVECVDERERASVVA